MRQSRHIILLMLIACVIWITWMLVGGGRL
jgi:hypothetical protein